MFKGRRKSSGLGANSRSLDELGSGGVRGGSGSRAGEVNRPATIAETSDDILAKYRSKKEPQPSGELPPPHSTRYVHSTIRKLPFTLLLIRFDKLHFLVIVGKQKSGLGSSHLPL